MKPIYWLIIAILAGALIFFVVTKTLNSGTGKTGTMPVKCGDKTLYRYSDPEQVFPEIVRNYETNVNIASGVLNTIVGDKNNSSLSVDAKNTAQVLIDTLNQENIFYQTTLKAYFIESNNDPCNETLRTQYLTFITQMAGDEIKLKEFITQISVPKETVSDTGKETDTKGKEVPVSTKAQTLAIMDTTGGKIKIDTAVKNIQQAKGKIFIMKDYVRLNSAVTNLGKIYNLKKFK